MDEEFCPSKSEAVLQNWGNFDEAYSKELGKRISQWRGISACDDKNGQSTRITDKPYADWKHD